MSAKQGVYHPKSIWNPQNQEYHAILLTFYQTAKTKREWLRQNLVHFREQTKDFELPQDQPVYLLKTKSL